MVAREYALEPLLGSRRGHHSPAVRDRPFRRSTRSSASPGAGWSWSTQHGGTHHGYFLPSEGASDIAYALFSFPSLAEYEVYRARFGVDPDFIEADRIRDESGCVKRFERTFLRPLFPDGRA